VIDLLGDVVSSIDPYWAEPPRIWGLVTYTVWVWCWGGKYQVWKDRDRIQGPVSIIGRPLSDKRMQEKKIRRAQRTRNREYLKSEIGYFPLIIWAPLSFILSTILFLGIWSDPPIDLLSGFFSRRIWMAGFVGTQIFGDITFSRM